MITSSEDIISTQSKITKGTQKYLPCFLGPSPKMSRRRSLGFGEKNERWSVRKNGGQIFIISYYVQGLFIFIR